MISSSPFTAEQIAARERVWQASQNGIAIALDAAEVEALWSSIHESAVDSLRTHDRMVAANVARLEQLARDADEAKAKSYNAYRDDEVAIHYAGMRDGLLRAVSVVKGKG